MEQCPRCGNYSLERFNSSCLCYQCNYSPDTDVCLLPLEEEPPIPTLKEIEEQSGKQYSKGA